MKNNKNKKRLKFKDILKLENANLVRSNKHEIWHLPNGKIMTVSKTSSDNYFEKVNIQLLNKLLGTNYRYD